MGLIAGLGMILLLMIFSAATGMGFWFPLNQIAAVIFGTEALIGGAGTGITGLLIHLAISSGLGAAYGYFLPADLTRSACMVLSVASALVVWGTATYLLLPSLNPVMSTRLELMPAAWFLAHLVYGGVLGTAPYLFQQEARVTQEPFEERYERAA